MTSWTENKLMGSYIASEQFLYWQSYDQVQLIALNVSFLCLCLLHRDQILEMPLPSAVK